MDNKGQRLDLTRHSEGHLVISLATFNNGLCVREQVIASGRGVADSVMVNRFTSLKEIVNVPTYDEERWTR